MTHLVWTRVSPYFSGLLDLKTHRPPESRRARSLTREAATPIALIVLKARRPWRRRRRRRRGEGAGLRSVSGGRRREAEQAAGEADEGRGGGGGVGFRQGWIEVRLSHSLSLCPCLRITLSLFLVSVCLFICLSVCLSVCLCFSVSFPVSLLSVSLVGSGYCLSACLAVR